MALRAGTASWRLGGFSGPVVFFCLACTNAGRQSQIVITRPLPAWLLVATACQFGVWPNSILRPGFRPVTCGAGLPLSSAAIYGAIDRTKLAGAATRARSSGGANRISTRRRVDAGAWLCQLSAWLLAWAVPAIWWPRSNTRGDGSKESMQPVGKA